VIRRLCVGREAKYVDPRGVSIKNARLVEPLDLSYCVVTHPLRLEATTFDAIPELTRTQLPILWLQDCWLPGVHACAIRTGELRLRSSFGTGEVVLADARIGVLGTKTRVRRDNAPICRRNRILHPTRR
jgi:hypothetical protein